MLGVLTLKVWYISIFLHLFGNQQSSVAGLLPPKKTKKQKVYCLLWTANNSDKDQCHLCCHAGFFRGWGWGWGAIMRPHQKKKDQKTSKCHTTAHLALCLELPEEKLHRVLASGCNGWCVWPSSRRKGGKDNVQPTQGVITCTRTEKVVQTSEAKDGLSSFLEAVFGDWRRVTVGTLVRPRPLRKAKQNDQPIYTFAKHSFIINKSPFFFV